MSLRRLTALFRDLSGRADEACITPIAGQIDATLEGARVALGAVSGKTSPGRARAEMSDIEHQGDEQRGRLIARLAQMLTTPIDREDLFRLSRSVDDVLDNLRDFVRELDLYQVEPDETFTELIEAVVAGMKALRVAVRDLVERPGDVTRSSLTAKKSGNNVRRLYQVALATLFDSELDVEMLKRRELLRRLDVVGLRMGDAADALADGAMKRSF
ncbi:MAG TPA: DUF47 family protein [Egibacteraceae bacterium]|nr:DUF47 family protein [Actinomycetota bacterium]HWB71062.1 DUF47 family protein [Egibacteraceae bacterium]